MVSQKFSLIANRLLGVLTVLIALVVVASYLGFLWWGFDLISHFSFWLGLAVAGWLAILVFFRRKWLSVLIVVVAFPIWWQTVLLSPWKLMAGAPSKPAEATLSVLFANINLHNTTLDQVAAWVEENEPDFLFVAEVSPKNFNELKVELPDYPYAFHQAGRGVFGIAVFSRQPITEPILVHHFTEEGLPSLEVTTELAGEEVHILATHPYPPVTADYTLRRNDQLIALGAYIGALGKPTLLVGDLNTTSYGWIYRVLLAEGRLQDSRTGRGWQPSWPSTAPAVVRLTIDHALHSSELKVVNREVGPAMGSDHLPILVEVGLSTDVVTDEVL